MSIQSLGLNECASASSSGLHDNSGLKWDQSNNGTGPDPGIAGCTGGTSVYAEWTTGDCTCGTASLPALS